jgi:hypothetical protein
LLVTSDSLQRAAQSLLRRTSATMLPEQRRDDLVAAAGVVLAGWDLLDRDADPHRAIDQSDVDLHHALAAWERSSPAALSLAPWGRLIVSIVAQRRAANLGRAQTPMQPGDLVDIFGINRLFHLELERQDTLRQQLGLSTTVARAVGLAAEPDSPGERMLQHDYALFAGTFALVESLVRRKPMWDRAVLPSGVLPPRLELPRATRAVLTPWFFADPSIEVVCDAIQMDREKHTATPRELLWRLASSHRLLSV